MVKQKKTKEELITPVKCTEQVKAKPTLEQMRIAQILEKKMVDQTIKLKLKQIMDATQRSADEVYVALHDSDFDENRAVDLLIEGDSMADWCTSEKRKKKLVDLKEKKVEEETAIVAEQNEQMNKQKNQSFKGRGLGRGRGMRDRSERLPKKAEEMAPRWRGGRGSGGTRNPLAGTVVFERSTDNKFISGELQKQPVKNQWEKPLLHGANDEWDMEEYTGSLSQTQIFTSKVKQAPAAAEDEGSESFNNGHPKISEPSQLQRVEEQVTSNRDPPKVHSPEVRLDVSRYEEKKPSRIPTSAVEMPPEIQPSLSFLDIEFGAMDLGPSGSDYSSETLSSAQGHLISSCVSSASNLTSSSSTVNVAPSRQLRSVESDTAIEGGMQQNSIPSHLLARPMANMNFSAANALSSMMATNTSPSANQNPRFVQSSQYNHPYSFMTPPNGNSGRLEPRNEAPSIPPLMTTTHLPTYKSPPGVPKGAIVANLPPGPLVPNQYIINQANVPYFPHHTPIYYYEDVPPAVNNQQRLPHQIASGYDVGYQQSNSSNRDSVHYNV